MKLVTTINGRLVRRGQDKISVFDNALLYAEGLFETLLAVDDHIIFMEDHLDRLYNGARVIDLEIPVSRGQLIRWMTGTVRRHPDRITKLRLTVTSGESARYVGKQGKPQVILNASPHELPKRPFRLWVSGFRVDQDSEFRQVKTLSYAIHAAALRQARRNRCDDALLLNERHHVAEVTSANVFWVRRGHLYTPPISAGCLEGITRKHIIAEASALGLQISEKDITLPALVDAQELFICSSLKLVAGVDRVRTAERTYVIRAGELTNLLSEHFRQLVGVTSPH
jgi:branched-chain amino acid aminotransferase